MVAEAVALFQQQHVRAADPPQGQAQLVRDFVAAWSKVMELDRFDLARR